MASPHPDSAPNRCPPQEGEARATDLIGEFLDVAACKLCIDARPAGVLKLDLGSVQINHDIPLL
jgi:hypothetical protein